MSDFDKRLDEILRNMLESYGVDVDDEYHDAPNDEYGVAIKTLILDEVIGEDYKPSKNPTIRHNRNVLNLHLASQRDILK